MRYHLRDSFCWRLAGAALSRARPLAQGGKPRTRTFSTTELLRKAVAPTLPHCDFSPQKYTGPTAQEVHDMRKEYLSPGAHCVGFWRQFVSAHFTLTAETVAYYRGQDAVPLGRNGQKISGREWPKHSQPLSPSSPLAQTALYAKELAARLPGDLKVRVLTAPH
eukprot:1183216-Prorocentrum_minimum.AAC.1